MNYSEHQDLVLLSLFTNGNMHGGERECRQLWDDVLAASFRDATHFTGSIVLMAQKRQASPTGIEPYLIIDGQQRLTTISLLLIALYRYSKSHPDEQLPYRWEEIKNGEYLFYEFQQGENHYKLTLSKEDTSTFHSIIDNLENSDVQVIEKASRIIDSLQFFEKKLNEMNSPGQIWTGLAKLEVAQIDLEQGKDNPQLIFESMNSTGKSLLTADLVRNFVLMGLPINEQKKMFNNYWSPIENLVDVNDDSVFNDFLVSYLTIRQSSSDKIAKKDTYPSFKNYVRDFGEEENRIEEILGDMQKFATFFAVIRSGEVYGNAKIDECFTRLRLFDTKVATTLLMFFLSKVQDGVISVEHLLELLDLIESFMLRRSVCLDAPSSSMNKLFFQIIIDIKKLNVELDEFVSFVKSSLLKQTGSARFPTDREFGKYLRENNLYSRKVARYFLGSIENSYTPKNKRDFAGGTYTIEHIMPQSAFTHDAWRNSIPDVEEEVFDVVVHCLGNLTLTAYNSELSNASFAEKKKRCVGGYDNEIISISSDLRDSDEWTFETIQKRGERLTDRALEIWQYPHVEQEQKERHQVELEEKRQIASMAWADLVKVLELKPGTMLHSMRLNALGTVTIEENADIRVDDGQIFSAPKRAMLYFLNRGGNAGDVNGWLDWRVNSETGPTIRQLRDALVL